MNFNYVGNNPVSVSSSMRISPNVRRMMQSNTGPVILKPICSLFTPNESLLRIIGLVMGQKREYFHFCLRLRFFMSLIKN